MNLILVIVLVACAIAGIVWAYPKLPPIGQLILVIVVAVACVLVLLSLAGLIPGAGFSLN